MFLAAYKHSMFIPWGLIQEKQSSDSWGGNFDLMIVLNVNQSIFLLGNMKSLNTYIKN